MNATAGTALLIDLSGSMNHPIDMSGTTPRQLAQRILAGIRSERPDIRMYAFSDTVEEIYEVSQLPKMGEGTALTEAFVFLRSKGPLNTLFVITDGMPDDPSSALIAALLLDTKIEVRYCGAERNRAADKFGKDLAACSRMGAVGTSRTLSLAKTDEFIEEVLRLSGPAN